MTKDTEIVLLSNTYKLAEITSAENREQLISTLSNLDSGELTESELRRYFRNLKIAMGAFIQKVSILETNIFDLRREQRAAEARMESMYLKAQLEIQSLKQEITEIKLSKGRINQIVKVAEALQGNAYAPYAIKSLVDGVVGQANKPDKKESSGDCKLPIDYPNRLEFAQQNGFKWNQNNREPAKDSKKLKILEEWEDQFCRIQSLTIEQILDKKYIAKLGSGAIAGALMFLEKELDQTLEERKSLSVFNCYQKAIKLYQQKTSLENQTTNIFDFYTLLTNLFTNSPEEDINQLTKRLEARNLTSTDQLLSSIKNIISKKLLPAAIKYDREHSNDTSRLYAIQAGYYDSQMYALIKSHKLSGQD